MEALIPKLFIITAEASLVFFIIIIVMIIFNSRAKRKDVKAVKELISNYNQTKSERISSLKSSLQTIGYSSDADTHAENLYQQEKSLLKEFVTLYLQRDTYRLLDYSDLLIDAHNAFLKTTGSTSDNTSEATDDSSNTTMVAGEATANAAMLAREQAELDDTHLKELSELRLKNTELNEHLFEALETITTLMSEHGKKTGQEVENNAQHILDAIVYLRDQRLNASTPEQTENNQSQTTQSIDLDASDERKPQSTDPISVNLNDNDNSLVGASSIDLGIDDDLNVDLDKMDNTSINLDDPEPSEDNDPWAEALAEQADIEAQTDINTETKEDEDPWAEALAEQADVEAQTDITAETKEDEDPWAEALAEQADVEGQTDTTETEEDPWAAALAEQEKSEKN